MSAWARASQRAQLPAPDLQPNVESAVFGQACSLADLLLDTSPYSSGATAVTALAAGLPLLTCPGDSFASRMGASSAPPPDSTS